MTDPLRRIADALERLAPPPPSPVDLVHGAAFVWDGTALAEAARFAPLPLDLLTGIDRQKAALLDNLARHAGGAAAHDMLLWGARGTGKSALVKSAVAHIRADRPALALVAATTIDRLPTLFATLATVDRPILLFLDDLGLESPAQSRALRSLLEGGLEPPPAHVRLAVTANRRHLVPRDIAEQDSAINPRDAVDDQLALADRFGLSLGFHALDQDAYLAIVAAHAAYHDLDWDAGAAIEWATRRGARSGRVAAQFVAEVAGSSNRALRSD
jgi:predicted AAA+ superfamily ATPase